MASGSRQSKRTLLEQHLERTRPAEIGEADWDDLLVRFAPISTDYLRRLLRASGIRLAPLVEGVRQENLEELERTLLALRVEYMEAAVRGDVQRSRKVRREVIRAKERARFSALRAGEQAEKRAFKDEMALWMLTWLENPAIFADWLPLRKAELRKCRADRSDFGEGEGSARHEDRARG